MNEIEHAKFHTLVADQFEYLARGMAASDRTLSDSMHRLSGQHRSVASGKTGSLMMDCSECVECGALRMGKK